MNLFSSEVNNDLDGFNKTTSLLAASAKKDGEIVPEEVLVFVYDQILECLSQKAFLDADLNIARISKLINVPSYKISLAVNRIGNQNIKELINRYRSEHAKVVLEDPNFWYYTIDAVGMETGFNNRVSFINSFKKVAGITPHAFRVAIQESQKIAS